VRRTFLCAYILLLFVSATTRDFGITPWVSHTFGPIAAAFVEPLWKTALWIAPALLYLVYFETHDVLGYLKLGAGTLKRGIVWGLIGSSLFFLRIVLGLFAGKHVQQLSFDDWLNSFLLVGLIEETVFRGFLFQELKTWFSAIPLLSLSEEEVGIDVSQWIPSRGTFYASTMSTLLFVLIHFPSWILQHQPFGLMLATSLFNLLFGYLLCAVLAHSRSLWACVIIHSINDISLLII
jgi:membrane protease YdiL (CAAX protease family)